MFGDAPSKVKPTFNNGERQQIIKKYSVCYAVKVNPFTKYYSVVGSFALQHN